MLSQTNKQTHSRFRSFTVLLTFILMFAGLEAVDAHYQQITDWWRLRNYQAPADIAALASQDTFNDYGRKLFYLNRPEITPKSGFTAVCPSSSAEQTIVLGCYHSGQSGIYLLDVTDQRLQGVEQVTAAHEMLHAAYERLDAQEKTRVDKMLQDYYKDELKDPRILKTIDAYKHSEPNDIVNEMHSIFGTEIADLPPPLEEYYKQYFADRSQIVAFAARYQSEFTSRQDAVAAYDNQLNEMKAQIDALETDIKNKQAAINAEQRRLVSLRNSGNVKEYNTGVPAYNGMIDSYNSEVQQLRDLINQYNQIVAERNAVALEENELVKDLSTQAVPISN